MVRNKLNTRVKKTIDLEQLIKKDLKITLVVSWAATASLAFFP